MLPVVRLRATEPRAVPGQAPRTTPENITSVLGTLPDLHLTMEQDIIARNEPRRCCDLSLPIIKRCQECFKSYRREISARNILRKKDIKRITRNDVLGKKSVYHAILCKKCVTRNINDYCNDCKPKYKRAKSKKCYQSRKHTAVKKVNKAIKEIFESNQMNIGVDSGDKTNYSGGMDNDDNDIDRSVISKARKKANKAINDSFSESNRTSFGGDKTNFRPSIDDNGDDNDVDNSVIGKASSSFHIKKGETYAYLLCLNCINKPINKGCTQCLINYNRAKSRESARRRRRQVKENREENKNEAINNQTNCGVDDSGDKIICFGDSDDKTKDVDSSFNGDTSNNGRNVKRSIYEDLLCLNCKYKIQNERCGKCKRIYNNAKTSEYRKKKKSIENDLNQSDLILSEESDSNHTYLEQSISKKTVANLTSKIRVEVLRSPRKQALVGVNMINKLPDPIKENAFKEINSACEQYQIDKVLTNVTKNLKGEVGPKNPISYMRLNGITSSYPEIFQKKSITNIKKKLKINWENASKIKSRTKLART